MLLLHNVVIVEPIVSASGTGIYPTCAWKEVQSIILVWPTSWTPAVGGLIACVCVCVCAGVRAFVRSCVRACVYQGISVSADMSPYCSAHGEWLIMKLHVCTAVCRLHRPTTCKTRPAGQVRPATRFCPAREMFLNYNGNRPAACH